MTLDDLTTMRLERSGRVATLILDRPDTLNAVGKVMHTELSWVFRRLAEDQDSDVIVLTGAGRAFCAGGDIAWLQENVDDPAGFLSLMEEAKAIVFSMLELPKPMICRMNGDAVGLGATLALCCDMIIAADTARFGDPHVRVGLVAGDGAAVLLPQIVGTMRAKELLLMGGLVSAEEGVAMGLFNRAVPPAELDEEVKTVAGRLASGPRDAIRYTKLGLNLALRKKAQEEMDTLIAYEALSNRTGDHAEAVAAMREKRKPQFKGR